jgi:hypothetical protein
VTAGGGGRVTGGACSAKEGSQDPKKRVGQQTRRDPQVDTPESALLGEEEETTSGMRLRALVETVCCLQS